jgi:hypothetical protein
MPGRHRLSARLLLRAAARELQADLPASHPAIEAMAEGYDKAFAWCDCSRWTMSAIFVAKIQSDVKQSDLRDRRCLTCWFPSCNTENRVEHLNNETRLALATHINIFLIPISKELYPSIY